ncbi:MAG TPA: hypothetical protein VIL04_01020 [Solirubrobacterales bacterium]
MKRSLTLLGLALLLAAPTLASAGEAPTAARGAEAKGSPQLSVRFILRTVNGKPVELRRFRFLRLEATCKGGTSVRIKGKVSRIKVKGNKTFRHIIKRKGKSVRIEGRVRGGGSRVTGFLRAKGKFGGQTGCDSGKVRWKATRA